MIRGVLVGRAAGQLARSRPASSPSAAASTDATLDPVGRRRRRATPVPSSGSSSMPVAVDDERPLRPEPLDDLGDPRRGRRVARRRRPGARAPAGLVSGPIRLNAVRTPISRRVGPACCIAGWKPGANRNAKPMLAQRRARRTPRRGRSGRRARRGRRPSPTREVIARLPCFATGTPAAATTSAAAVEMLNVPAAVAAGADDVDRAVGRVDPERPARASRSRTRPARRRSRRASEGATRSAASCAGVASPSMTAPIAARASSSRQRPALDDGRRARPGRRSLIGSPPADSAARPGPAVANEPVASSRRDASPSPGQPQEVREQVRALAASGRISGWNWTPSSGSDDVADAHHDPVDLAHRGDPELRRQRRRVDARASGSGRP